MRESWFGSGIGVYEKSFSLECPACDFAFEEELSVDDYGIAEAEVSCPECNKQFEYFEEVGRGQDS